MFMLYTKLVTIGIVHVLAGLEYRHNPVFSVNIYIISSEGISHEELDMQSTLLISASQCPWSVLRYTEKETDIKAY